MELGFVIDQRRCIGCHACTVACKAENDVPVGEFRTWVKYTEKGTFPQVRRHFTVLRCNHCDAAPCVEICPVVALHKRPDAIVDLDRDLCIGCRACMQACPYDAIYLNPHSGVAEKCHFCAHRTELGLEPACVIVCPEEAIVAGDVNDPGSKIAALIREQPTARRKLEKGTQPRVWYVDALEESLVPGAAAEPAMWLWSDRRRAPQPVPGWEEPPDLRTTLNADHPPQWGWHIWLYLWTKNVAAGLMLLAPFYARLGVPDGGGALPEIGALVFLALTGFLLVHDLGRPERFLSILLHPNPRSWLVKGTWALMGFGALTTTSMWFQLREAPEISQVLRWINLPLAALASGYTAFLFAQCKGRDLWLEKGLFLHLVLQAAALGGLFGVMLMRRATDQVLLAPIASAAFLLCFSNLALTFLKLRGGVVPARTGNWKGVARIVTTLLLVNLALTVVSFFVDDEYAQSVLILVCLVLALITVAIGLLPHYRSGSTEGAAKARDLILASKGIIPAFTGLCAATVASVLAMLNSGGQDLAVLGALGFAGLSVGLLLYEREFVIAGQEVPIS